MLTGFWYIASDARTVKAGKGTAVTLCNRPIVLFRDRFNAVHALEDRCSHRGVPLSAGWQEGDSIRCRYHGWRFAFCGDCLEVPATAATRPTVPSVPSFSVSEQDGWIWVYLGTDDHPKPAAPPPMFPVPPDGSPIRRLQLSLPLNARMDLAVDNFIDAAHVPFVHHGIFRQRHIPRLKEKEYTRLGQGFRSVTHQVRLPNTLLFRILTPSLAPTKTTIDFLMPGIHLETFDVGPRWGAIMVVVTPLTDTTTRLDFTVGWNILTWLPISWLVRRIAVKALQQDRDIIELQEHGHAYKTTMHLSQDADQLAVWYRRLKKHHQDHLDGLENLVHPVPEQTVLRWIT